MAQQVYVGLGRASLLRTSNPIETKQLPDDVSPAFALQLLKDCVKLPKFRFNYFIDFTKLF
jgi:hypothetical protein